MTGEKKHLTQYRVLKTQRMARQKQYQHYQVRFVEWSEHCVPDIQHAPRCRTCTWSRIRFRIGVGASVRIRVGLGQRPLLLCKIKTSISANTRTWNIVILVVLYLVWLARHGWRTDIPKAPANPATPPRGGKQKTMNPPDRSRST